LFVFALTKVGQLDVTFGIEKNVLELQVSVHDVVFVKSLESDDDLCCIEDYNLFGERSFMVAQVVEQTAACVVNVESVKDSSVLQTCVQHYT